MNFSKLVLFLYYLKNWVGDALLKLWFGHLLAFLELFAFFMQFFLTVCAQRVHNVFEMHIWGAEVPRNVKQIKIVKLQKKIINKTLALFGPHSSVEHDLWPLKIKYHKPQIFNSTLKGSSNHWEFAEFPLIHFIERYLEQTCTSEIQK